ncbi:hypothetical protein BJ684DRAFT_21344 [Piptocephalis cylindrospora]|uniref:Trs120/TRAPPC9 fourth Ig-like domain-containing protein n=1 Tax=Piptocephalis cylindrospora TaxID=1907219 RepID=A0A4P9Y019_9FUNG|nr:hypothetical protein BJ684DRAFT_21344 [Piptocephalis cylindrospora]|eukprot:RKP12093.1 hypothetical protein BJ684DRAFT_21344 [Piptocephalis cylindrospora]
MENPEEGGAVEKIGSGKYRVRELEMVQIIVRIRNRKARDVKLFLRIQPMFDHGNGKADCHLKEVLAVNGQPQTILPKIKERSEYVHCLPVCFLAGGHFTFACHAERTEDQDEALAAVESVPSTGSGSGIFQGSTVHVEVTTQL